MCSIYFVTNPKDQPIKDILMRARPAIDTEQFIAALKEKSQGNFMYVSYVLADIAARQASTGPLNMEGFPVGLQGYYEKFWSDIEQVKAEGWRDWKDLCRPVIERLAAAMEPVPAEWLAAQIGRDPDEVRERALLRWQRLLGREETRGGEAWRVVHRSFADFLAKKLDMTASHRAVADHYIDGLGDQWSKWDGYGLRYAVAHLAAAAQADNSFERHALSERLISLILNPQFQQEHLQRLSDPNAIERDLAVALSLITEDGAATPRQVAEVALQLVAFRKEQRQPQPIFDLAVQGKAEAAERRLDLFALEVDASWYQALLLTIAWLAAATDPQGARKLRDRVQKTPGMPSAQRSTCCCGA
jgi:hypothetical protein